MFAIVVGLVGGLLAFGPWFGAFAGAAVKASVVLLVAALVVALARGASAAVKHMIWTAAAGAIVALPLLSLVVPRIGFDLPPRLAALLPSSGMSPFPADAAIARAWPMQDQVVVLPPFSSYRAFPENVRRRPAPAGAAAEAVEAAAVARVAALEARSRIEASVARELADITPPPGLGVPTLAAFDDGVGPTGGFAGWLSRVDWWRVAAGTWLVGFMAVMAGLAIAMLKVRRLAVGARSLDGGRVGALARRLALDYGIGRPVRVLEGDEDAMPMTWGVVYPVLLLPSSAHEWSSERLRAVLLHELSHVRRLDSLSQLVADIACALYWFNPLVWIAVHRIRIEREHACDDEVLASGARASDYASELVEIARTLRSARSAGVAAIAMARPSHLRGRLNALLDEHRDRSEVSLRLAVPAWIAALAVVIPLAALAPASGDDLPGFASHDMLDGHGFMALDGDLQRLNGQLARLRQLEPVRVRPPHAPRAASIPTPPSGGVAVGHGFGIGRNVAPAAVVAAVSQQTPCWRDKGASGGTSINRNDDDQTIRWWSDACAIEARIIGKIGFNDDFTDVASITPGGLFTLEQREGNRIRRVEMRPASNGRLEIAYTVDGHEASFETDGRAWFHTTLDGFFQRSGYAAEERVSWLLRQGGPERVLQEVGRMTSDRVERMYLVQMLSQRKLDDGVVERVLRTAAERIESDREKATLLDAVAERYSLDGNVGRAFLATAATIDSDREQAKVLGALMDRTSDPAELARLVQQTSTIESDRERATLLQRVAQADLSNRALRESFVSAASAIGSSSSRSKVVAMVLDRDHLAAHDVDAVLAIATGIESDHEKARVLSQLAAKTKLTDQQRASFDRVTATIESRSERERVERAAAKNSGG